MATLSFLPSSVAAPSIAADPPSYSSTTTSTASLAQSNRDHGVATLDCCQPSHPFDDRKLFLTEEPMKVGRAVARIKPSSDNAIFDCKVLSRNHAVMWFEDGKFYLKDTKSSNGTFVNNQRLSKGSEESPPREVFSGDILQFGIDIMENSKKVTHGCIIALVRLYDRNGIEYAGRSTVEPEKLMTSASSGAISTQELYQLQQYIREAAYREQQLEQKLMALQHLLSSSQDAAKDSWQALIDEDRLLSRIEMLEAQLQAYSRTATEEKLREDLKYNEEHKYARENHAKEALRKALEEKTEYQQKLHDVERSLENAEEEASRLKREWDFAKGELSSLAEKHSGTLKELQDALMQLKDQEAKYMELERATSKEKADAEGKLVDVGRQEGILAAKVEALQHENDMAKEQIAALKIRVDRKIEEEAANYANGPPFLLAGSGADQSAPLSSATNGGGILEMERVENLRECIRDLQVQRETYKSQLEEALKQKIAIEKLGEMYKEQARSLEADLQCRISAEERLSRLKDEQKLSGAAPQLGASPASRGEASSSGSNHSSDYDSALTNGDSHPPPPDPSKEENCFQQTTPDSEIARRAVEAKELALSEMEATRLQLSEANGKVSRLQTELQAVTAQLLQEQKDKELSMAAVKEAARQQLEREIELRQSLGEQIEQLRARTRGLNEELEYERSLRVNGSLDTDSTRMALHRQAARNQVEFQELKAECARLKDRINAIENEITSSKQENIRLSGEYRRLQDSYRDLEQLRYTLESRDPGGSFPAGTAMAAGAASLSDSNNGAGTIFTYNSILGSSKDDVGGGAGLDEGLLPGEETPVMSSSLISNRSHRPGGHDDSSSSFTGAHFDFSTFDLSYEDFDYRTWSVAILSLLPVLVLFLAFLMAWHGTFGGEASASGILPTAHPGTAPTDLTKEL